MAWVCTAAGHCRGALDSMPAGTGIGSALLSGDEFRAGAMDIVNRAEEHIIIARMIHKIKSVLSDDYAPPAASNDAGCEAVIKAHSIQHSEHKISIADISDNALQVLSRLQHNGYQAYLVGGCVRDLMLGLKPKDFDVATDATPEQIKAVFRNCRLIGRRFRLAHVVFGREIIEVATFRGHHLPVSESNAGKRARSQQNQHGQLTRDNVFGTILEDAERRDFTFNAMYYDAKTAVVTDFARGREALLRREIILIGDAATRYREDPVRMLRAIRFAAKLDMSIPPQTGADIPQLSQLLDNIPPARLFDEVSKLLLSGHGLTTYKLLRQYQLFDKLFPQLSPFLQESEGLQQRLLEKVLQNTDQRLRDGLRITPAFFYAASLWCCVEERAQLHLQEGGLHAHEAFNLAASDVLQRQNQRIVIPKRFANVVRDIWYLQQRLSKRTGRRAYLTLEHPKFRAAYDFLLLRGEIHGGKLLELAQWWTEFQDAAPSEQKKMQAKLRNLDGNSSHRSHRRSPVAKQNSTP